MTRPNKIARLCKQCKLGHFPERRDVLGSPMWLHDSVLACPAADLHEARWAKKHKIKEVAA